MIGEVIQVPYDRTAMPGYRNATVLFETPSFYILDEHNDGWKGLYRRDNLSMVTNWRTGFNGSLLPSFGFLEELSRLHTPPPPTFDPTRPVQTRDGRPVRIYATDAGGIYPIHGAVYNGLKEHWDLNTWTSTGHNISVGEGRNDLINKETI